MILRRRRGGLGLNADAAAVLALLRERLFENPAITKVAHNLAFEAKFLLARGITLVAPVYDTMLAAMLIYKEEGRFRRLADVGLKTLAREWLGLALPGFVAVVGVGSFADLDPRDPATIDYAGHDAAVALQRDGASVGQGQFDPASAAMARSRACVMPLSVRATLQGYIE